MAKSSNKKDIEKNKQQKRKEKQQKKQERKNNPPNSFEDMIAYIDENGIITNTPPDLNKKEKINMEDISILTPKKEDIESAILNGRVEYFNPDKGYGFIKHIGSINKYFFHVSNSPASLKEGNLVTFELERGQKGLNAVRIAIFNKDNQSDKQ